MAANLNCRRFVPRFSLRLLLVAVTVFSIWLGWRVRAANYQRVAVRSLSQLPKTIIAFDHQFNEANVYDAKAELQTSKWLRKSLGDDFFQTIASVALVDTNVDRLTVERISHLKGMRGLTLRDVTISSDCGPPLRRLKDLEWFIVLNSKVEEGAFDFLGKQKNLTTLIVNDSDFTDRDMPQLKRLRKLTTLTLRNAQISDEGLSYIAGLDQVAHLNLDGANITDESIPVIETLESLKSLSLHGTRVTEEGAARLKRIFNGLSLVYGNTEVSPGWELRSE